MPYRLKEGRLHPSSTYRSYLIKSVIDTRLLATATDTGSKETAKELKNKPLCLMLESPPPAVAGSKDMSGNAMIDLPCTFAALKSDSGKKV